jgi:hypothetical protein
MGRLAIALLLAAVAAAVAYVLHRRRRDAPSTPPSTVPTQIDRADFADQFVDQSAHGALPWLIVVFTSATCLSCLSVWHRVRSLEGPGVLVSQAEVKARPDLHRRYDIDSVPLTVAVDAAGVVRASVLGPIATADLITLTDLVSSPSNP